MGIQVPLLTIVESGLGMSACSRTRRVTHLTLDDARVERKVKRGSPMLIGRSSEVVRRSSEVFGEGPKLFGVSDGFRDITRRSGMVRKVKMHIWKVVPGFRNFPEYVPEVSGVPGGGIPSGGGHMAKWYCSTCTVASTIHVLL